MRKLISLLYMALCLMTQTAYAQLIAEWKLQEDMVGNPTDGDIPLDNNSPGFEGWDISNCSGVFDASFGPSFQINAGGYAITPPISGLKTDAILKFFIKSDVADATVSVTIEGNGELSRKSFGFSAANQTTGWVVIDRVFLSKADHNTRLKFTGTAAFKLMAISLRENNHFYETFDNVDGTKGVDDFSVPSGWTSDSQLDNMTECKKLNAMKGKGCIYIDNDNTNPYQLSISGVGSWGNDAVLSFRVAGLDDGTGSVVLQAASGLLSETSFEPSTAEWKTFKVRVKTEGKSSFSLTFAGRHYFLDDVKFAPVPEMYLQESSSNDDILQKRVGEVVNIKLNRNINHGIWNTLCLPFDVDQTIINEATGYYNEATLKTLNRVENGVFHFTSVESVPAGTPFLIKLVDYDLTSDKVFRAVKLKTTTPQNVNDNGYGFYGTFNPVNLTIDGTNVFLAADQKLYVPAAGQNAMNGLRAFFVVPKGSASRAMVSFNDDAQAVVLPPADGQEPAVVRNLLGQPVTPVGGRLQPGCYVVNGRKVIIK